MNTVRPTGTYAEFKKARGDVSTLEQILQGVSKPEGNWDPNFREVLGKLTEDNPGHYAGMSPDVVIKSTEAAHRQYGEELRQYVIPNWDNMLKRLDGEKAVNYVFNVPLVETGDAELDKIGKAMGEKKKINNIMRTGEGIQDYVEGKIETAPQWRQEVFAYASGTQNFIESVFQSYARQTEIDFNKIVRNKNKTFRAGKLRDLADKSYRKVIADEGVDGENAQKYQNSLALVA